MDYAPHNPSPATSANSAVSSASALGGSDGRSLTPQPAARRASHADRRVYDNTSTAQHTGSCAVEAQAPRRASAVAPSHPAAPQQGGYAAVDPELERWIARVILGRAEVVVFTSAQGVRRVLEAAASRRLDFRLIKALRSACVLTSDAAAATALADLGLKADVAAADPLALVRELRPGLFYERTTALQLDDASKKQSPDPILSFLKWVRADVQVAHTASQMPSPRRHLLGRLLERVA